MNSNGHNDSKVNSNTASHDQKWYTFTDGKVLEEHVKGKVELFEDKIKWVIGLGTVIIGLLSFIGFTYIDTMIESIVKEKTEAKLESTLSPEYVAKKIDEKSKPVIDNVIKDMQIKISEIMQESLSYQELQQQALEAWANNDFNASLKLFETANDKLLLMGPSISNFGTQQLWSINCIASLKIFLKRYEEAFDTLKKYKLESDNKSMLAVYYFLECITNKLLKKDTAQSISNLESILKEKKFKLFGWDFIDYKTWIESTELSDDDKKFINNIINKMKKYSVYGK